jgi:hypothetical protein
LNISHVRNGTPLAKQSVPLEIQGQQLPINELNAPERGVSHFKSSSVYIGYAKDRRSDRSKDLLSDRSKDRRSDRSKDLLSDRSKDLLSDRSKDLRSDRSKDLRSYGSKDLGAPLDGSSVHRRKSCDRRLTSNIPLLLFIIPDFRENIGLFLELFLIGIFWRQSGRIAIIEDGHCYTYEKKKHADIEGV